MFRNISILTISFALLAFPSCRKEIPFDDPGTESKIVVDALLGSDRTPRVKLSRSLSAIENLYDYQNNLAIEGSSLTLTYQGNVVPLVLESPGVYVGEEELNGVGPLTLTASHPSFESVSANSYIPSPVSIFNVSTQSITSNNGNDAIEISFSISDPQGLGDYYHLLILNEYYDQGDYNPVGFFSTSSVFSSESDFGEDGSYFYEDAHFNDALFDGETINISVGVDSYSYENAYKIHLVKASEEYHKHLVTRINFNKTRGNFFAQPVQIFENIAQGHGILGGYSVTELVVE